MHKSKLLRRTDEACTQHARFPHETAGHLTCCCVYAFGPTSVWLLKVCRQSMPLLLHIPTYRHTDTLALEHSCSCVDVLPSCHQRCICISVCGTTLLPADGDFHQNQFIFYLRFALARMYPTN